MVVTQFQHFEIYFSQCFFTISFLLFLVLERVVNAICIGILLLLGKGNPYKTIACTQLAMGLISSLALLMQGMSKILQGAFVRVLSLFSRALVLTMVSVLVFTLFEFFPDSVVSLVQAWENDIGPALKMLFLVPLNLFVMILGWLVPIYNSLIWLYGSFFKVCVLKGSCLFKGSWMQGSVLLCMTVFGHHTGVCGG